MSLPPSEGVMKPWPLEREKYLHTPENTGPSAARADLQNRGSHSFVIRFCDIVMLLERFIQGKMQSCEWWGSAQAPSIGQLPLVGTESFCSFFYFSKRLH